MARLPPDNPLSNPLALSTPEAQAKWQKHEEAVARIYREHLLAVLALGEDEAQWHWKNAALKRGRGRPPGPTNPERDRVLVAAYDVLKKEDPRLNPAKVGRLFDELFHHEYGATAAAVEARLRRELKKPRPPSPWNRLSPPLGDK